MIIEFILAKKKKKKKKNTAIFLAAGNLERSVQFDVHINRWKHVSVWCFIYLFIYFLASDFQWCLCSLIRGIFNGAIMSWCLCANALSPHSHTYTNGPNSCPYIIQFSYATWFTWYIKWISIYLAQEQGTHMNTNTKCNGTTRNNFHQYVTRLHRIRFCTFPHEIQSNRVYLFLTNQSVFSFYRKCTCILEWISKIQRQNIRETAKLRRTFGNYPLKNRKL